LFHDFDVFVPDFDFDIVEGRHLKAGIGVFGRGTSGRSPAISNPPFALEDTAVKSLVATVVLSSIAKQYFP
jgi:hypothetical protein